MADRAVHIVRQLEQDIYALRIKKLLLYACKDWWESDTTRLSVVSLDHLIAETQQKYPTLEHLRSRLTHLVGTLNKSAEYVQIATLIATSLEPLYDTVDLATLPEPTNPIAQKLEQDVNLSRIKKLLICICRKYWEANPYVIEQIKLDELLDELVKMYPSIAALSDGLANTVKTLNKPIEYALIAETILQAVKPLYAESGESKKPEIQRESQPEPIDLFDVRLEIMKYANPLRAKIVLFSLAYYRFEFRSQDWMNLKLYSLDGLLRSVLSQSILAEDLHHKLHHIAQHLNEPEQYAEVVQVIMKALKPSYINLQRQIQQATQIGSVADVTRANSTQLKSNQDSTRLEGFKFLESTEKLGTTSV
jgi:hypothetical protein